MRPAGAPTPRIVQPARPFVQLLDLDDLRAIQDALFSRPGNVELAFALEVQAQVDALEFEAEMEELRRWLNA